VKDTSSTLPKQIAYDLEQPHVSMAESRLVDKSEISLTYAYYQKIYWPRTPKTSLLMFVTLRSTLEGVAQNILPSGGSCENT
jgi:hypothetical protein